MLYFCLGLLLLILMLAGFCWHHYRLWQLQRQTDVLERQQLLQELHSISQSAVGMGRRIHWLEKALRQLNERQDEAKRQAESENKSFLSANRLFEQGASTEQVMATCQLTRAEAELVRNIQQQSRDSRL